MIATGWTVLVGKHLLRLRSPDGRQWSMTLPESDSVLLVKVLRGEVPVETAVPVQKLLLKLAHLGATGDHVPESQRRRTLFETSPGLDERTKAALHQDGWAPMNESSRGELFAFVTNDLSEASTTPTNERIIDGGAPCLLVIVNGQAVSVGPAIDPSRGGPCLTCLRIRQEAKIRSAMDWSASEDTVFVGVGLGPPSVGAARIASALAVSELGRLEGDLLPRGSLTEMKRIRSQSWELETVTCHPLPWCPDCSQLSDPPRSRSYVKELGLDGGTDDE